jgi:hypothetical protein
MKVVYNKYQKVIKIMGYIESNNPTITIYIYINNGHQMWKILLYLVISIVGIDNNIMLRRYNIYFINLVWVWTLGMYNINWTTN